jgi:hypothetical protein
MLQMLQTKKFCEKYFDPFSKITKIKLSIIITVKERKLYGAG